MLTRPVLGRRAANALGSTYRISGKLEARYGSQRSLLTLAIETSCDDTSVAVLETNDDAAGGVQSAKLHFHERKTADHEHYRGIHPLVAEGSHQRRIAPLVEEAIAHLPAFSPVDRMPKSTAVLWGTSDGQLRRKPDFVSVTRGPGMYSCLSVGLNSAKGLALAWGVPLLAVHHMQAHALTPRLIDALDASAGDGIGPDFPFLTLLVSGGHTTLLSSTSLTSHNILAETADIAIGDCLDKVARAVLPEPLLQAPYGRALEAYAFPHGAASFADYVPPRNRDQELERRLSPWGWSLPVPLREGRGGRSANRMAFSFSGFQTSAERLAAKIMTENNDDAELRFLAAEVQRVAFEHLCGRLLLYLSSLPVVERARLRTLVVSGGVAANAFLRHVFRSMLNARGFAHVEMLVPPVEFCTDNAAMIAWAGCEMFRAGWRTDLAVSPIRKWTLDPDAEDGGILGAPGWLKT